MRICTDFTTVPDEYAKAADESGRLDGTPVVSFPFFIRDILSDAKYLHWEFVDDDAIEVCGFQWIHWSVANLPVESLMADINDAGAVMIPAGFSAKLPSLVPQAVQGKTSAASPLVGRSENVNVTERYNGPQPPNAPHDYMLSVYATSKPLEGLEQGFWLNRLRNALRDCDCVVGYDCKWLKGMN